MAITDGVIALRAIERDDLELLRDWRNDPELRRRTREHRLLNMLDQERWLESVTGPQTRNFMFLVQAKHADLLAGILNDPNEDEELKKWVRIAAIDQPWIRVGVVGLCHYSPVNATAECSFYIGDPNARGKGYATRALTLLHDYGFNTLNLARTWAECYANNEAGLATLKKIGYTVEGRMRQHVYRNGQRYDSYMLGLLKDEWLARQA